MLKLIFFDTQGKKKVTLNMDIVDIQLQSHGNSKQCTVFFLFQRDFLKTFFFFIKHTLVYNLSL